MLQGYPPKYRLNWRQRQVLASFVGGALVIAVALIGRLFGLF